MAGNLKSPSLYPMNPKMGEGPRFNSTERWVMRRSSTRGVLRPPKRGGRGPVGVLRPSKRARWGVGPVRSGPGVVVLHYPRCGM